jgi:hypothetical protein
MRIIVREKASDVCRRRGVGGKICAFVCVILRGLVLRAVKDGIGGGDEPPNMIGTLTNFPSSNRTYG